jgi:hypothetical protein
MGPLQDKDTEAFLNIKFTTGEGMKMREYAQISVIFMTTVPQGDMVSNIK